MFHYVYESQLQSFMTIVNILTLKKKVQQRDPTQKKKSIKVDACKLQILCTFSKPWTFNTSPLQCDPIPASEGVDRE